MILKAVGVWKKAKKIGNSLFFGEKKNWGKGKNSERCSFWPEKRVLANNMSLI